MKLKLLPGVVLCFFLLMGSTAQAQQFKCLQDLQISLARGGTSMVLCIDDGNIDTLRFTPSSLATPIYYLVTDQENVILKASLKPTINFEDLPYGFYRVWALSFVGQDFVKPGMDADTDRLASLCWELSDNYVAIGRLQPDGRRVSTAAGDTSVLTCTGDGRADTIRFRTTSPDPFYTYVVTDTLNRLVGYANSGVYDFEGMPVGTCRVYGLSYVGPLLGKPGDDITATAMADSCFDLSDNFIEIVKTVPDGGEVAMSGGKTAEVVCAQNDDNNTLSFTHQTRSRAHYRYVLTGENNRIISILEGSSYDFSVLPPGNYRIWGLSFTGHLSAGPGDDVASAALSDDCFELSGNFISIARKDPKGGRVRLADGGRSITLCVNDGAPDEVTFVTTVPVTDKYVYVITNTSNIVLGFDEDGVINFEGSPGGVVRVWGIGYSGNLTIKEGDNLANEPYSDECYERAADFVTVSRIALNGGALALATGGTNTTVCLGDGGSDAVQVKADGGQSGRYIFLVTDRNNVILRLEEDGDIDFSQDGPGVARIWGLNYTGELQAKVGDNAASAILSSQCYLLSRNFITVTRKFVDGGAISIEGNPRTRLCANDGAPDLLTLRTTSASTEDYAYLVTDENNTILGISNRPSIDFEGRAAGTVRIWGLSYTGRLRAKAGDNAATTVLSSECFELSANFVTLTLLTVEGGAVALAGGNTASVCLGGNGGDERTFTATGVAPGGRYTYLVTDEGNTILDIDEDGVIDFGGRPAGVVRVWGLHYTGTLSAKAGDNAAGVALSDECYSLSGNFVALTIKTVDGGFVAIQGGATKGVACIGDGQPDNFTFISQTTAAAAGYTFVITDANDRILVILNGNRVNFDVAPAGTCRVYGLSYTGNLTSRINININEVALSDECYDLSANFVTITKEEVTGGEIALAGGGNRRYTCPGDGKPDPVSVTTTGGGTGSYVFLVTDEANVIVRVSQTAIVEMGDLPAGIYRIHGLAYSGTLLAVPGVDAATSALSDACFERSSNFVIIDHFAPSGGRVALDDGTTERLSCPSAAIPPVLNFDSTAVSGPAFVYVITDENNIIRALPTTDHFDFGTLPAGLYRVWGLAYTGGLSARIGDNAAQASLSDICYDLSDNFIAVVNREPVGGTVATADEERITYTCPGDDRPDFVSFDSTGTVGRYLYLVTDTANIIRAVVTADRFDFSALPAGFYRVWGLAYIGGLQAAAGQNASTDLLATECFELSRNFIAVVHIAPQGGNVATSDGLTELSLCAGDGRPDLSAFRATGASEAKYAYLFTGGDNKLIGVLSGNFVDFDTTGGGIAHIWGLSYTGRLTIAPGQDITATALSNDCFDLSDNFIDVNRTGVDGGRVTSNQGEGNLYTCRGDGTPDVLTFSNTGTVPSAAYRYVITNENNLILRILEGNQQNFENTGFRRLRVWGISYTGNLLARSGQTLTQVSISDGCYTLSENFLTVIQDKPDGGRITTADNETDVLLCIGTRSPVLRLHSSSSSQSGLQYLLTDTANVILSLPGGSEIDFSNLSNNTYRVWALSYTGSLLAAAGQDMDRAALATSCIDLSDNFITVRRSGPVDGGQVASINGQATFNSCPRNGVPDVLILTTSSTVTNTSYRFVITDTNNRILIPDIEGNVIDFDGAAPGTFRVWGVSFVGSFTATFGQLITSSVLSSECYDLSDNFVTVTNLGPNAGNIRTSEGLTGSFATVSCGGAAPDKLSFAHNGSGVTSYYFLISREDTILAVVAAGASFDFSSLACGTAYQVTGLAYTGAALPNISGLTISQLLNEGALPACFDLSNNRLNVTQGSGLTDGKGPEQALRYPSGGDDGIRQLSLVPNPASSYIRLQFTAPAETEAQSEVLIFSASGQLMSRQQVSTESGENQVDMDVSALPRGVYFLYLRNGVYRQQLKFVKG